MHCQYANNTMRRDMKIRDIIKNAKMFDNEDEAINYLFDNLLQIYRNRNEGVNNICSHFRIDNECNKLSRYFEKRKIKIM